MGAAQQRIAQPHGGSIEKGCAFYRMGPVRRHGTVRAQNSAYMPPDQAGRS
jgi:hypothetical protein